VNRSERWARLGAWLAPRVGVERLRVAPDPRPPELGASNETEFLEATWTENGAPRRRSLVLRTPPRSAPLFDRYDLPRQYRTLAALATTAIPVPKVIGLEPDSMIIGEPFFVMERVPGITPPDNPPFTTTGWLLEAGVRDQRLLHERSITVLAEIHRLDPARAGLRFLGAGRGSTGFEEQLAHARSWFRWAAAGREQPTLERVLAWLLSHRPDVSPIDGVNWGDARIGNMLYLDFAPVAVLDWEMAALGPAEVDLGWWLFLDRHHTVGIGRPPLPGFPDDATTVSMYEEKLGRRVRDLFYYEVFAGFRFGLIMIRAARRTAAARADLDGVFERVNPCTRLLAGMLDLPEPR
jgi:aminoglycoside phosphotransferase (APT) family kinase protein